jgi:predicted SprT family Zn-dependent metalloprotease
MHPYIDIKTANELAAEVFESAMNNWRNYCVRNALTKTLNATKDYGYTMTVDWKKIGFRCAGRTCREKSFGTERLYIEMNINYLYSVDAIKFIKHTLIHELAHLLAYKFNGSWGHDKTWKAIASILGDDGKRCHNYATPENRPERKTVKRIRVKCPNCRAIYNLTPYMYKQCQSGDRVCRCGKNAKYFELA